MKNFNELNRAESKQQPEIVRVGDKITETSKFTDDDGFEVQLVESYFVDENNRRIDPWSQNESRTGPDGTSSETNRSILTNGEVFFEKTDFFNSQRQLIGRNQTHKFDPPIDMAQPDSTSQPPIAT